MESIKDQLAVFDLEPGASLLAVRIAYLDKTTRAPFLRVILTNNSLSNEFSRYHRAYLDVLEHFSQNGDESFLEDYPPNQAMKFLFNHGVFMLLEGNPGAASEEFSRAAKIDKEDVLTMIYMGITLFRQENYPAAGENFSRAVKKDKQNVDAWFYMAENYARAGEYRKAYNFLETAGMLDPMRNEISSRKNELKKILNKKYPEEQEHSFIKRLIKKLKDI
ncbi:MAG: tetratricopeptide repeat protein [bacterium]|nr:tetratricopeptide repeat protein [bacterium]